MSWAYRRAPPLPTRGLPSRGKQAHFWCCCSDAESFNRDRQDEDSRDERDQGVREACREMTFVLSIDDQVGICCME